MTAAAARKAPCFVVDERGAAVSRVGTRPPSELRSLADAAEAIQKCASRSRYLHCGEELSGLEAWALAVKLTKGMLGERATVCVPELEGVATGLQRGSAYVWRVRGAAGVVFASNHAPEYDAALEPLSKQADFPRGRPRQVKLRVRKDDGPVLPDKQIVYGIVLEPETVDSQGDIYSAQEIENAAHRWLEEYQNAGHMHDTLINQSARVCESYCAPCDFEIGGESVKAGTWVIAFHVTNDALWEQVKDGTLTGFSIGGYAQRVPAQQ